MMKSKFLEEEIAFALRDGDLCTGGLLATVHLGGDLFNWNKKLGSRGTAEMRRQKHLGAENIRLKDMVPGLGLDKEMLQERKSFAKALKPVRTREMTGWMVKHLKVSARRALGLMSISRSLYYYIPKSRDSRAERARIKEIAETRVRYGVWRIHTLMRREG